MSTTLLKNPASIISAEPGPSESGEGDDLVDEAQPTEHRHMIVAPTTHGARLDKALVQALPEFSRSYLQQLIEGGAVDVNGLAVVRPSARLKAGDSVGVCLRPTAQSQAFKAQAMDLRVVFEDAHLLVIDKPAGLVVHPAPGNWSGTLLNGLLAYHSDFAELPRAGIVHRLDKDTSGLMLVARTRQSMDTLVQMIAARSVQRQYLALVHRPWSGPKLREVQAAIGRDPRNRLRMAAVDPGRDSGKAARTSVEVLQECAQGCLVRCTLHTGRTHQIRVHMAHTGHPLVADGVYGGVPAAGLVRQALHAFRLALPHPASGAPLEFVSALPPDLANGLAQWGLRYNSV
ncbi:MAG: RluA family pseudouridine synthase [Betaproteobacteria bacterium]|nr:RluA family pseudouridine synthase [Betaproteobacteria bacterium]